MLVLKSTISLYICILACYCKNISLWEGVLALKGQIYRRNYNNSSPPPEPLSCPFSRLHLHYSVPTKLRQCKVPTTMRHEVREQDRGRNEGQNEGRNRGEMAQSEIILGFRVPTTCDGKKFDDIIECLGDPTTCKKNHHPIYIHRAAKGLRRSPPRAQNFGAKTVNQPLRWL